MGGTRFKSGLSMPSMEIFNVEASGCDLCEAKLMLDGRGLLNWSRFDRKSLWGLGGERVPQDEREGFLRGSAYLKAIGPALQSYWDSMEVAQVERRYRWLLEPLHKWNWMESFLVRLSQSGKLRTLIMIGAVTSWIDRLLFAMDEYLSPRGCGDGVNSMKRLLRRPWVAWHFGDEVVYLLRLLVGPLHGLNLRNLYWHGFLSTRDRLYTGLEAIVWLLYLSLIGMSPFVLNADFWAIIEKRTTLDLDRFDTLLKSTATISIASLVPKANVFMDLIKSSHMIVSGQEEMWTFVFGALVRRWYYEACVVALPLVESSLRAVYVRSNGVPSFRLSAEIDTLCLSLNIILDRHMHREHMLHQIRAKRRAGLIPFDYDFFDDDEIDLDAEEVRWQQELSFQSSKVSNRIFTQFRANFFNALFDLLLWSRPVDHLRHYRLRDHVAHGVIDPTRISDVMVGHLTAILVELLSRDLLDFGMHSIQLHCRRYIDDYRACFHPKVVVLESIRSTRSEIFRSWETNWTEMNMGALQALSDSVEHEKRPKDRIYELGVDLRAAKYKQTNHFVRDCLERCHDVFQWSNIVSPLSVQCLTQLKHVLALVDSIRLMSLKFFARFRRVQSSVSGRTAWKKQRLALSVMLSIYGPMFEFVKLQFLLMEDVFFVPDFSAPLASRRDTNKHCSFLVFLNWVVTQIVATLDAGSLKSAEEIIEIFYRPEPKTLPRNFSPTEARRAWADLPTYLSSIHQRHFHSPLRIDFYRDPLEDPPAFLHYSSNYILFLLTNRMINDTRCKYPDFDGTDASAQLVFQFVPERTPIATSNPKIFIF